MMLKEIIKDTSITFGFVITFVSLILVAVFGTVYIVEQVEKISNFTISVLVGAGLLLFLAFVLMMAFRYIIEIISAISLR